MIKAYSEDIEKQMLNFYNSLSEKDRRRYAAIETTKLGYGGASYIRRVLHCDDRTITRGQQELKFRLFSLKIISFKTFLHVVTNYLP